MRTHRDGGVPLVLACTRRFMWWNTKIQNIMITKELTEILTICCEEFECSILEVMSKSRAEQLVFCRKAFGMIAKTEYDVKNSIIAQMINRSHQSVARYTQTLPINKYFKITFLRIRERIKNEIRP